MIEPGTNNPAAAAGERLNSWSGEPRFARPSAKPAAADAQVEIMQRVTAASSQAS